MSKVKRNKRKKTVVLLSGGLDSATTLYYALGKGYAVECLIFDYGQRHKKEVLLAKKLAQKAKCQYHLMQIAFPWKGSALLDKGIKIPQNKKIDQTKIPVTYVPGRNIIFLSFAASYAEAIGAKEIFIGANAVDYSGYPDCRPEFIESFNRTLQKGLKAGVKGTAIKVTAPFLKKTKSQIIEYGMKHKVPYENTWSCYKGLKNPCRTCDSCLIRKKGFDTAGYIDPIML